MLNSSWEQLVENLIRNGILLSPEVIRAMREVPRQLFLQEEHISQASIDSPLSIGEGQTVSAPLY